MKNSLYKFEHKCVLEVCVHIHPIMIKIHILKSPFSSQAVLRFLSGWCSSAQAPPTIIDCQDRLTLAPPPEWAESGPPPVQKTTRTSQIERLRRLVVGCYNEYSSRNLLPTSEPLKTQRINVTFVLKGMSRSPICINASVRENLSWSRLTYRRSEYKGFYESLHIAFPNNVLVSSFTAGREGRGQQSSLAFKATWTKNRFDFDRVKKGVFTQPLRHFNKSML